ncbi:hypothetical protein ABTO79_19345, partial [Acinetobacter baumannii]
GHRRWINSTDTYACLQDRGVPGPNLLPAWKLNALPDLTGEHANCTPDVAKYFNTIVKQDNGNSTAWLVDNVGNRRWIADTV